MLRLLSDVTEIGDFNEQGFFVFQKSVRPVTLADPFGLRYVESCTLIVMRFFPTLRCCAQLLLLTHFSNEMENTFPALAGDLQNSLRRNCLL